MNQAVVHTAGHGTRTAEELCALLCEASVSLVADVRSFPGSRRNPQHARAQLECSLPLAGIRYVWLGKSLGGRRKQIRRPEDSPNTAWLEPAFRNYADYLCTADGAAGVAELEAWARKTPTAILCAERLFWRCHRRIIADALLARGWQVVHLLEPGKAQPHTLTAWARVTDGVVTYPALV
ncbi:MAG TPA: hypothetical protein DEP35_08840 [Deltaproteobacteria bacterium]|jgi:uncharacterized protein (DUF488 family)|nr:hypothetical protein [Deltaproteobacteria bacterium]